MKIVKAGDILEIKTGKYDANHAKSDGKYRFFTCAMESSMANTFAFDDEVLILPGNGANVGEVFYYNGKLEAYQRTYVLHNISQNTRYLYYYFKKNWIRQITKRQVGSATNYIKMDDIVSFEIPLPPLTQQQKIANILDVADELRQNEKALIAKYDELTQALFLYIFGDPVSNPKGWGKVELKQFGKISTGNTPSRADEKNYSSKFIEWIKTDNIKENNLYISEASEYLSDVGIKKARTVEKDAILVACIAAALTDRKVSFNQQINAIESNSKVNPKYLYYLIRNCKKHIQNHASNGMKRMLTKGEFEKILMILPPLHLQNQFVEQVSLIEEQKAIAQKSLEKSEELFNSLLQKAFRGELI
jgi:type I restriction enzyme S subunit